MRYQDESVLQVIDRMSELIRSAHDRLHAGGVESPYDLADQAVGLALDMDPAAVSHVSPQSLASVLEMSNPDDRIVTLLAEALEIEASYCQANGRLIEADLRVRQAASVRSVLDPNRAN